MDGMNRKKGWAATLPVLFLLCFSAVTGCKQWVDEKTDTLVMENVLGRAADAFEEGNIDALGSLILREPSLIVVGPRQGEVYYGWDAVEQKIKSFLGNVDQLEIDVTERQISPGIDERTAYYLQTADVRGTFRDRPFNLQGLRMTGVMERHGGRWLIVLAHLSVSASDGLNLEQNAEMRL